MQGAKEVVLRKGQDMGNQEDGAQADGQDTGSQGDGTQVESLRPDRGRA